jgi:hypothetical protein
MTNAQHEDLAGAIVAVTHGEEWEHRGTYSILRLASAKESSLEYRVFLYDSGECQLAAYRKGAPPEEPAIWARPFGSADCPSVEEFRNNLLQVLAMITRQRSRVVRWRGLVFLNSAFDVFEDGAWKCLWRASTVPRPCGGTWTEGVLTHEPRMETSVSAHGKTAPFNPHWI